MPARRRTKATPKSNEPERITDEDVNAAVSIIQRDYYQDVRDLGDSIKAEVRAGDIDNEEQLDERVHEDVDGAARVIYTWQAKLGMLVTDNEDAWEEFGYESPTVEQKMFCAMKQDVMEYIGDFDSIKDGDDD
jgi:hypothetical protein